MAERTVSVKLIADTAAYVRGMDDAARKTQDSTRTIEQQLQAQEQAYQQVGTAAMGIGLAALAGVTAAVVAYSQFDAAMSNVQAATGETTGNMEALSDAALQAGADTVYSATEAAAAIEELSKAGVSTGDILGGGLTGSLDLAAAGEISVAEAAETAASAMTQFGLAGDDVTHIADLLASAAGNAQGGVSDMGQALSQSGLVASQMGLSIEETTGTLAAFASAGLLGSDAGTSFRAMLLRLANPTNEVATLMDDLGLSFYDAQGEFIGMEGVASQLTSRMSHLTQEQRNAALATIFGQDAIRAASILYDEGAAGIAEWTATVDDSGYAAEQAAARLDNLQGDLEALGGAWETLMIALGAGADGPLRFTVQSLDFVLTSLAGLDPVVQMVILSALGLTGAIATVGGAALVALPQVAAFRASLTELGIAGDRASRTMNVLKASLGLGLAFSAALTGASVLTDFLSSEFLTSQAEVQNALATSVDTVEIFRTAIGTRFPNPSLEESRNQIEGISGALDDVIANWRDFGNGISPYNVEILASVTALGESIANLADTDLGQAQAQFAAFADQTDGSREQMWALLARMPEYRDHLIGIAEQQGINVTTGSEWENQEALISLALGETGGAADEAASAVETYAAETQTAAEMAQELYDVTSAQNDLWFNAQDAMIAYEQSLDDLQAAINSEEGLAPALDAMGTNFDLSTESGREAASMLQAMVENANANTEAMIANGDSAEDVAAFQARARDEIANLANQMDATGGVAGTYTERLNAIPTNINTQVAIEVGNATQVLETWMNQRRVVNIEVTTAGITEPSVIARNGVATGFDSGGRIPGPYLGYDDRLGFDQFGNVYGLAGDEWIINAASSSKWDHVLRAINNDTFTGFDSGGRVGPVSHTYAYQSSPVVHVTTPAALAPNVQVDVHGGGVSPAAVGALAGNAVDWKLRRMQP